MSRRGLAACWLVLVLVMACARSDSPVCGELTCAAGSVCGVLRGEDLCLLPGQDTVCGADADGTPCNGETFAGICDGGYCLPGCGDGRQDPDEQCDDGNFRSHDGCSSACVLETLAWREWMPPPFARYHHASAYDAVRGQLLVVGGVAATGQPDDIWTRQTSDGRWSHTTQTPFGSSVLPAIAYDAARERVVLFGGFDGGSTTSATWEYDGDAWTQVTPVQSPGARYGAAMVYDPTRSRVVLFGGQGVNYLDDTWEYDGVTWTQIATTSRPPPRRQHTMAWDATQGRIVLFGGQGATILGDTWVYANGTWALVTTAVSPVARLDAAMAYLPSRDRVVLFGGRRAAGAGFEALGDTWELSGSTWSAVSQPVPPPVRYGATLSYDGGRQRLVLVAGSDTAGRYLEDVWEYRDDGTWEAAPTRLYPAARGETRAVYDDADGHIVMFGGRNSISTTFGDTWIFDGAGWHEPVAPSPTRRYAHGLAYDAARATTVMFGGFTSPGSGADMLSADTWEWDGEMWSVRASSGPSARSSPAMADAPGDRLTLFGGDAGLDADERETWQYSEAGWQQLAPAAMPPASTNGIMAYDPIADRTVLLTGSETWVFAAGTWTQLASEIPYRANPAMVFDTWRQRIIVFGGHTASGLTNELWELDGDTWHPLTVSGLQPAARHTPGVAFMPQLRSLVMFGGNGADNVSRADTWMLRFDSTTLDEVCDNGVDDDGDLQLDEADPDCAQLGK